MPQKWFSQPEEVAELVSFLLGDGANYINVVTVSIDGGYTGHWGQTQLSCAYVNNF